MLTLTMLMIKIEKYQYQNVQIINLIYLTQHNHINVLSHVINIQRMNANYKINKIKYFH